MKTSHLILPVALAAMLSMTSCETILRALDTDTTSNTGPYAIPLDQARQQALFLSDKMAYELNLTDEQYAAVYEINLDYLLQQNGESTILGSAWTRRNSDLYYVLSAAQYDYYRQYDYFYQPLYWSNRAYAYRIYSRYNDINAYYYSRPSVYATYRGGHNRGTTSYYDGRFGYRSSYAQPPAYGQPANNQNRHQSVSDFGQQRPNDHGQGLKDMLNNAGKNNTNTTTGTFGSQQRRSTTTTGTSTSSGNTGSSNNPTTHPTLDRAPNPRQGTTSKSTSTFQPVTGRQNNTNNKNNSNSNKSINTSRQGTTTVNPNATKKTTTATQQQSSNGSFGGHR